MATTSATGSSATTPEPSATITQDQPIHKAFSCVLCAQRKVKCDKIPGGCNNCTKARVPCIYKAPPPPRRRRKGVRDVDVITKLRIYEDALQEAGIDPEILLKRASSVNGKIVDGHQDPNGASTLQRSRAAKDESEEVEVDEESDAVVAKTPEAFSPDVSRLMFGSPISSTGLRPLHPLPVEAFKLWQTYLDNINPLIKLFHAPTVQQLISEAYGNLNGVSRNAEALLFSIYCIAVESLSDKECISITGESREVIRKRFRTGAQHALINASFLKTSDLIVLQALTLFIVSLQNIDARIVWMLSGVAQRIGQRIGLHRDGDMLKLPPFEAEIRRRLWWQIIMLEGFTQKLAGTGTGSNASTLMGNVKLPANLNDSDLFPGMKELPKESDRATEMMFFLIRCHVGEFLKRFESSKTTFDGVWNKLTTSSVAVEAKEKAIVELERLFEQKFLRHCDSSITWHLMCSHLAKGIIFMMRFMAYSASYQGKTETQAEKDALFSMSLQVLASSNLVYTTKEMQGFMWHVNMHFQWKAYIYVLSELRYRTSGPAVEQAWQDVQLTYEYHPTFDEELAKRALPTAVSNLALKAWDAYIAANGVPQSGEPLFIQLIRSRQDRKKKTNDTSATTAKQSLGSTRGFDQLPIASESMSFSNLAFDWNSADLNASMGIPPEMPDLAPLDYPEEMNWSTWNNLLVDFQTDDTTAYPPDMSTFSFNG
ncbi:hypothetical protein N0V86_009847 [Didymella sp. IMI 355093]|nr:hypothetical protein N0V86_009847 [Didymella sp. IMI 355093]